MQSYHRFLFQWHCRHFFRFRRYLSEREKNYLEVCFELPDDYREVSPSGYTGFSYYTYSHRIDGERVNSSRLAYGSILHSQEAWKAALPVLQERGLELPRFWTEDEDCHFYGLGWDLEEQQFKVYVRCSRCERLPAEELQLLKGRRLEDHLPEGLLSLTWTGGCLSERKVYLYPRDQPGVACLLSDRRGAVAQLDVHDGQGWEGRLSQPGRVILGRYRELNEELDTIAFQDRDHYTLYFP